MEHIVKLKTKLAVEGINRLLGYKTVEIMTPEEVLRKIRKESEETIKKYGLKLRQEEKKSCYLEER